MHHLLILLLHLPLLQASDMIQAACSLAQQKNYCKDKIHTFIAEDLGARDACPPIWDNLLYSCWPKTSANTTISVPCPEYIPRDVFQLVLPDHKWPNATLECLSDGTWKSTVDDIDGTVHIAPLFGNCINEIDFYLEASKEQNTELGHDTECEDENCGQDIKLSNQESMIQIVGHAVSMFSLFISISILLFFEKLRNTRNFIHVNLMVSLFIRGVTFFLQHASVNSIYAPFSGNETVYSLDYCDGSVKLTVCRTITVLENWAMTTTFYWLLIEGIQLFCLLVATVMSVKKYFYTYMTCGWGMSWVSVIMWAICKKKYENKGCWEVHHHPFYEWIIRLPILVSILSNFIIYVVLAYVIISKLRVDRTRSRQSYHLRLARSTLTLIPLMGTEYILFAFIIDENSTLKHIRYKFDLFFISFQGLFVSVLFCFMNQEVKREIRKLFNRKRRDLSSRRRGSMWDSTMNVTFNSSMRGSTIHEDEILRFNFGQNRSASVISSTVFANFLTSKRSDNSSDTDRC